MVTADVNHTGKSTTISLIEFFYNLDKGSITLDGVPITDMDLAWYRSQIGLVQQEPILFSTTIANNIRYGKPDATDEEVIEAAKAANAHNFIEQLADKYKTECGERGTQMSGGQKQRIAIARAVLKNPQILLLDEATSALDAESEHLVQDALEKLMKDRTSIVIARTPTYINPSSHLRSHPDRLSTIQNADTIVVINKGEVIEKGTHQELLDLDGLYANLVHRQLAHEEEAKVAVEEL